jgi:hypothetical protein
MVSACYGVRESSYTHHFLATLENRGSWDGKVEGGKMGDGRQGNGKRDVEQQVVGKQPDDTENRKVGD